MRSSSGEHYIALDHIRALAVFLVFSWHFLHEGIGFPVAFDYTPSLFFFSIVDEGHTGVALFMTLSGYLFAKLLESRRVNYRAFFWNRLLRLGPLLAVALVIGSVKQAYRGLSLYDYALSILQGIVLPTLPNGGWSLTVEFHFYLLLPALLLLSRRSRFFLAGLLLCAVTGRYLLHQYNGEVQSLAYLTLIGRIDQFLLGILAFHYRQFFARQHAVLLCTFLLFSLVYWQFDIQGGYYHNPSYPSPSLIWVVLPTLEGLAYAIGIAYYDQLNIPTTTFASRLISRIGCYSYSIYLLHFYFVFHAARFVHNNIIDLSNFYVALAASAVCFSCMIPIGYLSYRFIESPFLKYRRPYLTTYTVGRTP